LLWLPALAGCGAVGIAAQVLTPNRVTVRLVNNADFTVEGNLRIGDQQDIPEDLLDQLGSEVSFSLAPGGAQTISRSCGELQAVRVENADLRVIGGIGPSTNSDVVRDSDEFNCGDTIEFTFDNSAVVVDFAVSVSVQAR